MYCGNNQNKILKECFRALLKKIKKKKQTKTNEVFEDDVFGWCDSGVVSKHQCSGATKEF